MPWSLLGLAGLAGALAAWLTVILLVFPPMVRGGALFARLRGWVNTEAATLAAFASEQLLTGLPPPSRFFEQLGPDRFRREFARTLRTQSDVHVDDVMARRNGRAWDGLSIYARNRVYAHVQRRMPFVVDDFVDHVQRELDDIVRPPVLVHRHFEATPDAPGRLFLEAFGADMRARLPLAALAGALAGLLAAQLHLRGPALGWVLGAAALAGCLALLASLALPARPAAFWPLRMQGILYTRRHRFLRLLARELANDALAWRALAGEFLHGAHAARARQIMRREVGGILDTAVFKTTLQLLLGPEGVHAVKQSAVEKAMEVLSVTPVSAVLRESCRVEIERTLEHQAGLVDDDAYRAFWQRTMGNAWRFLPPLLALCGFLAGLAGDWLAALA